MSVSLSKGGNVNLSKEVPNLSKISVGLGWKERSTNGADFDLDASAFMLASNGRVRSDKDFIFYNELRSTCGSVVHQGDNRVGSEDDQDSEVIKVDLNKVPDAIQRIAFTVTIHEAKERNQSFGMVTDAFIRIVNDANGQEVAKYDLTEDAAHLTSMIFAELYRNNGDWKFRAVGQGFEQGLGPLATNFGVSIA